MVVYFYILISNDPFFGCRISGTLVLFFSLLLPLQLSLGDWRVNAFVLQLCNARFFYHYTFSSFIIIKKFVIVETK